MKLNKKLLKKNLQQLEKEFPNEILPKEKMPLLPLENSFSKIPLEELGVEELCFTIMHGFGWKFLIPLAIEVLTENPFVEGENSGYGLLRSVLSIKPSYWQKNPDLFQNVEEILKKAENVKTEKAETILTIFLPQKIYDFRKNKPQINE